jgi:methyltransferase (TIGR00027 family)
VNPSEPLFRNISDTALWAAMYRARETERRDALFRDPYARRLAGERGEQIAARLPAQERAAWAWVMRTVLFDRFIAEQVEQGASLVVNLAAGLDARPYRMPLPPALQWVEVDLPAILNYKEEILKDEKPVCALERVRLDLADVSARRDLFQRLGQRADRVLVVSEGLVIYLAADEVGLLAQDLATPPSFQRWTLDVVSPGLVRMLQKQIGTHLDRASAPLKFGPEEGPGFFTRYGWRPLAVRSLFKEAVRAKRVPLWMRVMALLPESDGRQGSRPWSGVCLLERQALSGSAASAASSSSNQEGSLP